MMGRGGETRSFFFCFVFDMPDNYARINTV